jgi:hypothetical protein
MIARNKRWRENPELRAKERVTPYVYAKIWKDKDKESDFEDDPEEEEVEKEIGVLEKKLATIDKDQGFKEMMLEIKKLCLEGQITKGVPLVWEWGGFRRRYIIVDENGECYEEEMDNYNINNKFIK